MKQKYTAKDITVLEGLEPVRKRPGMYILDTVATSAGARYQELCVIMFGSLFRSPSRL